MSPAALLPAVGEQFMLYLTGQANDKHSSFGAPVTTAAGEV